MLPLPSGNLQQSGRQRDNLLSGAAEGGNSSDASGFLRVMKTNSLNTDSLIRLRPRVCVHVHACVRCVCVCMRVAF
jgi:hypothetical protein